MRAVVLVTGDEVLEGRTGDRNGRFLARELYDAGVDVVRVEFLSDRADHITTAMERAFVDGATLVITSGGLGLTHDDLTMQAVADALGLEMECREEVRADVAARCAGHPAWRDIDAQVRDAGVVKQATLPRGAVVIPPVGTAPGVVATAALGTVVVLPGPPSELVPMWRWARAHPALGDLLAGAAGGETRVLRISNLIEARLVEFLSTLPPGIDDGVRMGICARAGEVEVTLRAADATHLDTFAAAIADRFAGDLVSSDGRDLDHVIADLLRARGATVAVAESCTGGMVGARFTGLPGSSAYFHGGVIAYDNAVKTGVLGVDPAVIATHGAVSDACARQMAAGVRRVCATTYGLSVTGVAGPGGGTPDKPVGAVFVAACGPRGERVEPLHLRGERDAVRERAVGMALHALRRLLVSEGGAPPD